MGTGYEDLDLTETQRETIDERICSFNMAFRSNGQYYTDTKDGVSGDRIDLYLSPKARC